MIRRLVLKTFALALSCLVIHGGIASAVVTPFADQTTTNLVYSSIEETNSSIISGFTLYGGVGTSGESLTFDANNFRLESFGGVGALDGRMSFSVSGKNGTKITSVKISEVGSASTFGVGALSNVYLVGFATIDGLISAPEEDEYNLVGGAGLTNSAWQTSIEFDGFGSVDQVDIDFDNRLFVFAPQGGYAYVDKKGIVIEIGTTTGGAAIPEPSSAVALLACGIVGTTVRRQRKR